MEDGLRGSEEELGSCNSRRWSTRWEKRVLDPGHHSAPSTGAIPLDFHYTRTTNADPPDIQRQKAEACLVEMGPADLQLFTSGATDGGTERMRVEVWCRSSEDRSWRGCQCQRAATASHLVLRQRRFWQHYDE